MVYEFLTQVSVIASEAKQSGKMDKDCFVVTLLAMTDIEIVIRAK